jgi:glycosyltransferase involved in cell wall biosynthesis
MSWKKMRFNPVNYPICFREPLRLTNIEAWHTHIPFAFVLVEMLRPNVIVELGVHKGDSYCAFCQAVDELNLKTRCYAVDTWKGDEQAGFYGEEVFSELREYSDLQYGRFSELIRSTFDDAVGYFPEHSIDLLHIDGQHQYEAVKHDFEAWLPKMSDRGVVLLHDTNVRERAFGVWKFWDEIHRQYPHFEFTHGEGLGLIAVGQQISKDLQELMGVDEDERQRIASFFFSLGRRLILTRRNTELSSKLEHSERENTFLRSERRRRDQRISDLNREIAGVTSDLNHKIAQITSDSNRKIAQITSDSNHKIAQITSNSKRREADLKKDISERDSRIGHLDSTVGGANQRIATLERELALVYQSQSWFITKPLRWSKGIIRRALGRIFQRQPESSDAVSHEVHPNRFTGIYRRIPLSPNRKRRIKQSFVGRYLPGLDDQSPDTRKISPYAEGLNILEKADRLHLPSGPSRILVVDERLPTPDQDSGSARMSLMLKLLREIGHEVTFVSNKNEILGTYDTALKRLGIHVIYGFSDGNEHLKEQGHTYRYVILSRPETAFAYLAVVRAFALHATVVYDTVDLAWVRMERKAELCEDKRLLEEADYVKRMEHYNISGADIVISITEEERETILREESNCRIEVIPNIHQCVDCPNPYQLRKDLMFIGGFWHSPNEDAVIYFADSILPRIQEEIPDIIFYIIGSNMPSKIKALEGPNIKPMGYVPDPSPYFHHTRIFVAPLRYGAGMKGKVGQSMSFGLPVVTTSIGAEGMRLTHNLNVLIADNAEHFAEEVVRLYSQEDLWNRISTHSISYVSENLSEAPAKERLLRIFGDADGQKTG